jgi:CHAD domain-containing protein
MERPYAEKYIKKQFNLLRKNIPRSFNLKNWDAIHDFRVALKRIVSILKFIKQHDLKKNISALYKVTRLNYIYDTGGELREIQINRRILKTYRERFDYPILAFSKFLKKKEKTAARKLRKSRVKFSQRKCRKFESQMLKTFRGIPENEILTLVDRFISGRIAEIESLILDHHVESRLHRIRKLIKSIKYMLEMTGHEKRSYGTLNFTIEKITLLEDHIGRWHDLFVFQEEVNFFRDRLDKHGKSDPEVDLLVHVVQREYEKQFNETVQHIYTDFDIPERAEY